MSDDSALQRLLDKIQAGDEDASTEVYNEYVPYLRMVVRRHINHDLRAKFDSLDVVQSVWADLLDGLRKGKWTFESPGHLRAFLIRATKNRLVDYTRRYANAAALQTRLNEEQLPEDTQPRPSAEARANEKWNDILRQCRPEHRKIIELKRDGYSLAEIAEQSGYHPSSIRRILYTLDEHISDA